MTNSRHVKQFQRKLKKSNDTYSVFAANFKKADTAETLVKASRSTETIRPQDVDLAQKALSIFTDKKNPANLRVNVLGKLYHYLYENKDAVIKVINVIADNSEPANVRYAALNVLLGIRFSSPALTAAMSDFKAALQVLTRDKSKRLKSLALVTLAAYGDPGAHEEIKSGLQNPAKAIIPEAQAIQLLSQKRNTGYYDVIRDKLANSNNPDVVVEAIHALSGDAQSQNLIQTKLQDKSAMKEVRLSAFTAMQAHQPEKTQEIIKKIVADKSDYDDIKIAGINSINRALEQQKPKDPAKWTGDSEFTNAINQLKGSKNPDLKNVSDNYLDNLNQLQSDV